VTVGCAGSGEDWSVRLDGLEAAGSPAGISYLPGVADRENLVGRIRASVIGDDTVIEGPFGGRRLVYADYTASGRAGSHEDVVIFCGTGATGAIDKLVQVLGLRIPAALEDRYRLSDRIPEAERPVVFVGPYEHHSNELPWRESIADVVAIGLDADGGIDLEQLEDELRRHAGRLTKIGSFSAASNVTGIVTDVDRVAVLLHRHGALSCWDYASAGPYLPIEMNPSHGLAYKDAVFLSPHKFVGGPGTPGVLVAKRSLFRNAVPSVPGGGTVSFVTPTDHSYDPDPEVREEGGTPAIVESIRAGLVFALKDAVGTDEIRRREHDFARRALESWRTNPRIEILGSVERERLAIVSFALRHPPGLLHSNFVAAALNDLFGIQARSGCFCAGPYLHRLYGIDERSSRRMHAEVQRGQLGAKLSFVRVGFNYFTSEAVFDYVVRAVHFLADHGWKLLPLYRFEPRSGLWEHAGRPLRRELGLEDISYGSGRLEFHRPRASEPESVLPRYLEAARRIVAELEASPPRASGSEPERSPNFEEIRWFPLPGEALAELHARRRGSIATDL
jgi:selenocysteine lyase/cysteine desulfurase